ncbi:MAG: aminomethyl-transferring glycine dehydrogenase subunit GcvPB [Planctomycetota bacterium]
MSANPGAAGGPPLIFERSRPGRRTATLPPAEVPPVEPADSIPDELLRRRPPALPETDELTLVRHYTRLSQQNFGIDTHFYPLGSCSMKYNPRLNETLAAHPALAQAHPYQADDEVQGTLQLLYEVGESIKEITGFPEICLQPAAGAHGEATALMVIRARLADRGDAGKRNVILFPDSAHGTNPASVSRCGFTPRQLASCERGLLDLGAVEEAVAQGGVAALMVTIPNTLGLFETDIRRIADVLHDAGAYLYVDGANLNAILGVCRPHDFGADVMHINTHKTFSTPHGGGGPGAGPIAVSDELAPYLPAPLVVRDGDRYALDHDRPKSIGRVRSFFGQTGVYLRAWAYLRALGPDGVRRTGEMAVLNANYLRARLRGLLEIPHDRICGHEFVASAARLKKEHGVRALDVAKRLLDLGFHPSTIYFPLIVPECLMIEPTETESKETLDAFAEAIGTIVSEAQRDPEALRRAPRRMPVGRLDEVAAVKEPHLRWIME